MRKLNRPDLSHGLQDQLNRQTRRIRKLRTHEARRAAAQKHWKHAGKVRLRRALVSMAGGHDRCVYCGYNEAGTVDHFYPKSRDPKQTFHWRNLHLACSRCQAAKLDLFHPLLLNPARTSYQPWDHLEFEPMTGEYGLLSPAAEASESIYKWSRGRLPDYRHAAFGMFQAVIEAFAIATEEGNAEKAAEMRRVVQNGISSPGLFDWIMHWCAQGVPAPPAHDPLHPAVRDAVRNYPEIRDWL
jgi:hypothetical protein